MSLPIQKVIKAIMKEKDLTPTDLHEKSGVSRSTIYNTINGGNPTFLNVLKIAKGLNYKLSDLVKRAELVKKGN